MQVGGSAWPQSFCIAAFNYPPCVRMGKGGDRQDVSLCACPDQADSILLVGFLSLSISCYWWVGCF